MQGKRVGEANVQARFEISEGLPLVLAGGQTRANQMRSNCTASLGVPKPKAGGFTKPRNQCPESFVTAPGRRIGWN